MDIRRNRKRDVRKVGHIHRLRNKNGTIDAQGVNPLDYVECDETIGTFKFKSKLSSKFKTYDYVLHKGYENLATWVEEAARIAGR